MSINLDVIKNAAEWVMDKLLPKFTILTGIFLGLGALTLAIAAALKLPYFHIPENSHPALMESGKYAAGFWAFMAIATVISEMRRNTKARYQIHAEQIRLNPNVPDSSAIPQVQKEITKQIVEGTPSGAEAETKLEEGGPQ